METNDSVPEVQSDTKVEKPSTEVQQLQELSKKYGWCG